MTEPASVRLDDPIPVGSWGRAWFTSAAEGDQRQDPSARETVSARLGIGPAWATVRQVHGAKVVAATEPGDHGEADGIVTRTPGLPLAVFTADCLGVVIAGDGGLGVAHAGWRGLAAGVLEATVEALVDWGVEPREAVVGPAIGPCCFEVGEEVAVRFPRRRAITTWGTGSVDLVGEAADRLGIHLVQWGGCTRCGDGSFSHRRDRTPHRMAALGWLQAAGAADGDDQAPAPR